MSSISDRLAHAWNQFKHPQSYQPSIGTASYTPSTYVYRPISNERSVVSALYNRIAMDVSSIDIKHCVVDKETGGYIREYNSGLNNCLQLSANVDQTGRALIQELVLTMFDEGCAALVPYRYECESEGSRFVRHPHHACRKDCRVVSERRQNRSIQ